MTLKIECNGATHVGMVRSNNEDTYLVSKIDDEARDLCLVIDGIGGYEGGEEAAEITRETVFNYLNEHRDGSAIARLKEALTLANNTILDRAKENPSHHQMGCVATAAIIDREAGLLSIVHIGDTRLYMYKYGQLTKLTHDHSLIGYREEMGLLTEAEAMQHPNRNMIERCLGTEYHKADDPNFLEAANYALDASCELLLCSDGLCDMITSDAMVSVLKRDLTPLETADALIDLANKAGGRDNVTVVIAQIVCEDEPAQVNVSAVESTVGSETAVSTCDPTDTAANAFVQPEITDDALEEAFGRGRNQQQTKFWSSPRNLTIVFCAFIVGVLAGVGIAVSIGSQRDAEAEEDTRIQHERTVHSLRDSINALQDSVRNLKVLAGDTTVVPAPIILPDAATKHNAAN